jgi:hypothetical protein
MVSSKQIEQQLKRVDCHYTLWGSSEIAELTNLLMDDEEIAIAINGYYEGGFGLLVATNFRVLIIDKKPFVLNLEDLRYEMITEVTYGARLLIADMRIAIPTRTIYFDSWSMEKLHKAMRYIQQHVLQARDNGNVPTVSDWFRVRAAEQGTKRPTHTAAERISRIARSAFIGANAEKIIKSPSIGHSSSMRGINPYSRRMATTLRRRLPAFYH